MKIDVWSDVICPFCYIGKRRLELALEQTGVDAEIVWHSFELNPQAPASYGMTLPEVMSTAYGASTPQALAVLSHEEEQARSVGLDFQWRTAKPGNTFIAHRVLQLAASRGLGAEAEERFFRGYFSEGEEIGSADVVRRLALDVGLEAAEVDEVLAGDRYAREVRADEQRAADLGVRGVPFFVVNDSATVSGAQSVEHFAAVLRDEAARVQAPPSDGGAVCHDGVCEFPSA